jgi:hypothetical protein
MTDPADLDQGFERVGGGAGVLLALVSSIDQSVTLALAMVVGVSVAFLRSPAVPR